MSVYIKGLGYNQVEWHIVGTHLAQVLERTSCHDFSGNSLRIREHEASLGLLKHWHVGSWVLLNEDSLTLRAHVAVDFISHLHFEWFFAENQKVRILDKIKILLEAYFLAVARQAVSSPTQSCP